MTYIHHQLSAIILLQEFSSIQYNVHVVIFSTNRFQINKFLCPSSVILQISSGYFTTYPRRFQRIWGGVSAWVPPVGHDGVEPPLEAAQVVGVIHVGLREWDVTHKVLKRSNFYYLLYEFSIQHTCNQLLQKPPTPCYKTSLPYMGGWVKTKFNVSSRQGFKL